MRDRSRFEHEISNLGLREESEPNHKWPRVMFEFDVHYGFLSRVDKKIPQTAPPYGTILTTHT